MTKSQRQKIIGNLINTSVDDCRISLERYTDPTLLCDLLIKCKEMGQGHTTREQIVRRRISKLINAKASKVYNNGQSQRQKRRSS